MKNSNSKILTWAQIDLEAVKYNFKVIRKLALHNYRGSMPRPAVLAVVKADAYGHGMIPVAKVLSRVGADFFGVSNVGEGVKLRVSGIKKPILLFENPLPEFAADIVAHNLTVLLCTLELAVALNQAAKKAGRVVEVHIKVDTGMGRLGIWHEEAEDFVRKIRMFPNLKIVGMASHFPVADTDSRFTRQQIHVLEELIQRVENILGKRILVHCANSIGLSLYPTRIFNLVRPGLMLYGLYPNDAIRRRIRLKAVMSVKSRIIFIKKVRAGRCVSYGQTFRAHRSMTIATLAIGYSDGYFRGLSNKAKVLVGGKLCPQLGRVTMDQIMVDVSKVKNICLGQEAVLLGRQRQCEISAEQLATWANTINYEIVCNLGNRALRVYNHGQ